MTSPVSTSPTPLPSVVRREQERYLGESDTEVPLIGYAVLTGTYAAAVAAAGVALHRSGRELPRVGLTEVALLGVSAYKLSRLITRAKVTSWVRAPFTVHGGPANASEFDDQPRGHGLKRAVGELLSCPFCASQWSATALTVTWLADQRLGKVVMSTLAAVALADVCQYAVTALDQEVEG